MNARKDTPAPDMGGLGQDWQRLKDLRRGDKENNQAQEKHEKHEKHEEHQAEQPARRPSKEGRTRGGRKPPPAAADAIPTTVRFDPEESSQIDRFVLELRDDAGRRALDKAEVVRELTRLAREDEGVRRKLLRRLK